MLNKRTWVHLGNQKKEAARVRLSNASRVGLPAGFTAARRVQVRNTTPIRKVDSESHSHPLSLGWTPEYGTGSWHCGTWSLNVSSRRRRWRLRRDPPLPTLLPPPPAPQSLKPALNARTREGTNLGPAALSHRQRTSSFVMKFEDRAIPWNEPRDGCHSGLHSVSPDCVARADTALRIQWAQEKGGSPTSAGGPLTQRERQLSRLTRGGAEWSLFHLLAALM